MKKHVWATTAWITLLLCMVGSSAMAGPKARIVRDNYGVPHIYASTLEGLFFGFGYAAAEDRLFQMELFRRTFWGRLSEVLGEKLLPFDQGNRRDNLSLSEVKQQVERLRPEIRTVLRLYARGINAYIQEALADPENKLPREFHVLGFTPEPWGPEDVAADFLSVMGFFMDVSAELANASMLRFLTDRYGNEKGTKMFDDWCWGYDPKSPTTVDRTFRLPRAHRLLAANQAPSALQTGAMEVAYRAQMRLAEEKRSGRFLQDWMSFGHPASYAVVVAPGRSATGSALLMGGPQFDQQLPSALHEAGLHGAGIDVVGSTLAGYPFIMFGHNRRAAFSSTAGIDNIEDIYTEKLNPENPRQYWYRGAWRDMEVRKHIFRIQGKSEPVVKEEAYTVHGPVFYLDEAKAVAFSKRLSCRENFMGGLASFYDLMKAETLTEFNAAAQESDMSINYFFANMDGDIAYYHLGLHPIRPEGFDMRLPAPGTGEYEWQGYLPKSDNPHGENPPGGFIVNWNNQPAPGWGHADLATSGVWGGWGRDDRVSCLIRLVEAKKSISPEDLQAMIRNIAFADKRAKNIKRMMIRAVRETGNTEGDVGKALAILADWDNLTVDENGDGKVDHAGAIIFDRWWRKAVAATFGDEFGEYRNVFGLTGVQILSKRYHGYHLFHRALEGDTRVDYFGRRKGEILAQSLREALAELAKEQEGSLNDYRMATPMDRFVPVTVLGYFLQQPITSSMGKLDAFPLVDRGTENHIVNLTPGRIQGVNITPPGNSGFLSNDGIPDKHFADQFDMFVNFTYKPILFYSDAVSGAKEQDKMIEVK